MSTTRLLLLLLVCLASGLAFASSPYLVADLNPLTDSAAHSSPYFVTRQALNGAALFVARGPDGSEAIWRTDGTSEGTYVLLPVDLPGGVIGPSTVFLDGNTLYLGVYQSDGYRVWKTDGTAAGTVAVTAPRSDAIYVAAVMNGGVVFFGSGLRELLFFNGSDFVTLATLRTGSVGGGTYFPRMGGHLYVGTETGLWKSDGTVAGTTKILNAPMSRLGASGNRLFFEGIDATAGRELWTSDGTAAGTRLVADLRPGAASLFGQSSAMAAFGNGVLFIGANGEIGTSDGTAQNTRILLTGGVQRSSPSIAVVGSTAFFTFDDGVHGRELWRTDGTTAGTRLVRDASDGDTQTSTLFAGATLVYYYGGDRTTKYELFESDGTEAGTRRVTPDRSGWRGSGTSYQTMTTNGDAVFFSAETAVEGIEPWFREGADLRPVGNLAMEAAGSSLPDSFFAGSDSVLFSAMNRFWRTDGTAEGTRQVTNGGGMALGVSGNALYFSRPRASLFRTAETGSEILIRNFDRGFNIPSVLDVTAIGGNTYVRADDGRDTLLYRTDGTAGGLTALLPGALDGPGPLVDVAGQPYFLVGGDGAVYTTNGTPETTRSVARPDDRYTWPLSSLIPFNGELYLFAEHQRDRESVLWKFSGTAGHAEVVKRFPGNSYIERPPAATAKELLFSWQADSQHPNQLWKTDGTADGTVMIREFSTGCCGTSFTKLVSLGDRVVFGVDDGVHGIEPWVSDGTEAGTVLLRDIHPTAPSNPQSFVIADGIIYFTATDPEHGAELWQTDGTPQGTRLVADLLPGTKGSSAQPAIAWGDALFFPAWTVETGRELWALPLLDAAIVIDDVRVRENAGTASVAVRLTRASNKAVSVAWKTADAAARAGRDYTSSSGTLTFAPGETTKTIAVPLLDNAEPGVVRAFTVRLENGTAPMQDMSGAVMIEDDDVRTDVVLSLVATAYLPLLKVTNAGPSAASNVRLCHSILPDDDFVDCGDPFELAVGASFTRQIHATGSADTILARVSQWEPDTNPANNEKTWQSSGWAASSLYVEPATPRVGQTGTISVGQYDITTPTTVTLTSSDPTIVSVPANVIIPAQESAATTTFTALRPGTVTLSAKTAFGTETVTVRVYGAQETVRALPIVSITSESNLTFGDTNVFTARVAGVTAGGAKPTGTVTFYEGSRVLATRPLVNGTADLMITNPTPGGRSFSALYSGDANFLEQRSASRSLAVLKATPRLRVVSNGPGGSATIIVTGVAGQPPSGTLTVTEQGAAKPVTGPLAPSTGNTSETTVQSLSPSARTVTITYPGDAYYSNVTVTIPVDYGKHRTSRP
ncbi:MAG TPA: Ig-like domain repeat protein [Thermoanaerobaculia bacterium]|nr:Ig-like domain repeat protein [Thermoanaerobaculia bacterium]